MVKAFFVPDDKLNEEFNIDGKQVKLIKAGESHIDELSNSADGYLFSWDEVSGMTLFCILNNASVTELDDILNTERSFEIAFTELNDCGFLSVKFGNLPWGEGVFEPCLYKLFDMPNYDEYETMGMALNICVVDPSKDGLVMGIRTIGLGHEFSKKLSAWANKKYFNKIRRSAFTLDRHYQLINQVFSDYNSDELQRKANFRWHLGKGGDSKNRNPVNRDEWERK